MGAFDKYKIETRKEYIEALGEEIELRVPNLGEAIELSKRTDDQDAMLEYVASIVVDEYVTVDYLKSLNQDAMTAISEIVEKVNNPGN